MVTETEQAPVGDDLPSDNDTLRDDLEAAISEVDTSLDEGTADAPQAAAKAPGEAQESPGPRAGEESGEGSQEATAETGYPDDATKYPTLTAEKTAKAPPYWRPAAKEGWDKLPPHVQREIHRRELDIGEGLQTSGESRRVQERVLGLGTTYGAAMAAEGVSDPLDAAEGLFRTAAQLRMGTAQEKASRIAQLISHYGIDLELLDSTLADGINNGSAPRAAPALDPALAAQLKPMQDFIADMQSRLTAIDATSNQAAEQSVSEFRDTAEFIDQLRLPMADLLDTASNNNLTMTLQEAYDIACQMNPEIRGVLAQRAEAEGASQAAGRVARKVATAGASVHVKPAAPAQQQTNGSMRADILAAMSEIEGR